MTNSEQISELLNIHSTDIVVVNGEEAHHKSREWTDVEKKLIRYALGGELTLSELCELVLEGATALREKVSAEKYKIEIILHRMELLTTVQGMIEQADMEVKIAWNNTKNIRRDSPTVATFAQALGLSDEDIDELFYEANQIKI